MAICPKAIGTVLKNPAFATTLRAIAGRVGARFDLALEIVREGGTLRLDARPIAIDHTPLRIRGRVGASLYRAARAAGPGREGGGHALGELIGAQVAFDDDLAVAVKAMIQSFDDQGEAGPDSGAAQTGALAATEPEAAPAAREVDGLTARLDAEVERFLRQVAA